MFGHRKEPSITLTSAPSSSSSSSTPSSSAGLSVVPPALQITDIPLDVFYRLCDHIKNNYLDIEGLFRISGAVDEVRSVRESLAKDPKMPLSSKSSNPANNAHLYASVLTSYLREQPTSLLPFTMYDDLCRAQAVYNGKTVAPAKPKEEASEEKKEEPKQEVDIPPPPMTKEECQKQGLEMIKACLEQLPDHNKLLLHCLLDLLSGVNTHSDNNKMTASNLGVVFGPTLVKKENEDLMSIMTMTDRCDIIATIIRNYSTLFPEPPNSQKYIVEGQGVSLLRQSTRHNMSRKARSTSFSQSKAHDKWFESFPGFQSARTLLAQAEAVVETQMTAESEAQKRIQRQTVDPQTLAMAMKLSGGGGPAQTLQKELDDAREEAHRTSLALSQVIIKLVEIIREKAALEDENARLYARLETELSRKGYMTSNDDVPVNGNGDSPVKNRVVADVRKRVDSLKSEDFAFEPHDVLKKLDILQARMVRGCSEALPSRVDKTLVAVSNTIKRSADVVQSLQTSTNSGADFVKQLLDESSQQLQTIANDISLTRTRMSAVAEREIGATAHSIMAYACGEEKPDSFTATSGVKEDPQADQKKKAPPPQSDLSKAMAVLGITVTHATGDEDDDSDEDKKDDSDSDGDDNDDGKEEKEKDDSKKGEEAKQ